MASTLGFMGRTLSPFRPRPTPVATLLAAGFILLSLPTPVRGDGGVALDLSQIAVDEVLDPGRQYQLPQLTVRNPGDRSSTYRMSAGGIDHDEYLDPANGWFTFEPMNFELAPNASQTVTVTLTLPDNGLAGEYYGLLRAELMPEGEGPLLGVAAGAEISFSVTEAGDLGAFLRWLRGILAALAPWSYIVPLALVALLVGFWVTRRFRFRIEAR